MISLGHDEYYSQAMRDILVKARDSGTNIAFLGANAIYRQIRFEPTPLGSERLVINYGRVAGPDHGDQPEGEHRVVALAALPRPESDLTGVYYQCNPVKAPMVVADASSWLLAGTGLKVGDKLAGLVGSEYDQVTPSAPTPRPIEVLFHSPVTRKGTPSSPMSPTTRPLGRRRLRQWYEFVGLRDPGRLQRARQGPRDRPHDAHHDGQPAHHLRRRPAGRSHPAMDNLDALNISTRTIHDRK